MFCVFQLLSSVNDTIVTAAVVMLLFCGCEYRRVVSCGLCDFGGRVSFAPIVCSL